MADLKVVGHEVNFEDVHMLLRLVHFEHLVVGEPPLEVVLGKVIGDDVVEQELSVVHLAHNQVLDRRQAQVASVEIHEFLAHLEQGGRHG